MPVRDIKLIKIGTLAFEEFEQPESTLVAMKHLCGMGGGSNVTYIETEDKKLIVDTGFEYEVDTSERNKERNMKMLREALANFGLKPEDIDLVFMTHLHRDHFGNLGVFKAAEVIALKSLADHFGLDIRVAKAGEEIADGVGVMTTPGHTEHHASLLLQTERIFQNESLGSPNIVAAGDAIVSHSYYLQNKFWHYNTDFFSAEKAIESIKELCDVADFIIPGHGGLFKNTRK